MKNLLLYSIILCTSATCLAQLYVQPNGTAPSYVYVKDQVVFVEQGINLVENSSSADTKASLYLRDQGQLIQGASNEPNEGTGYISVYQDSHSDSYDYNYWGSPVGNNVVDNSAGNKNFGTNRFFADVNETDSNPSAFTNSVNATASPGNLQISNRWIHTLYPGAGFQRVDNRNDIQTGYGFTMKGTNVTNASVFPDHIHKDQNNQNYDFRGRPNNGEITVVVEDKLETLAGNPYPSALDLARFVSENSTVNSIRYWDEDRSINSHLYEANKGGYGVWQPDPTNPLTARDFYAQPTFISYDAGGTPLPQEDDDEKGLKYERRFAPIGQGFIIIGNGTGTALFKNSHRVYQKEDPTKSVFQKNSSFNDDETGEDQGPDDTGEDPGDGGTVDNRTPFLRIYTKFGESHFRDMILFLSDQATDGYDNNFEATHPYDAGGNDAYFKLEDNGETYYLVMQGVPYTIDKKVEIDFNLTTQRKISVAVVEQINLPGIKAYLFDSQDDTYKQITDNKDAFLELPAGNYEGRFYITFKSDSEDILAVEETTKKVSEKIIMLQDNRNQILEIRNPENYDLNAVNIFDINGKLVINKANLGNNGQYSFPTGNLSDGIYIVKLITKDNLVINNKISVFNRR